ncbi:hypothetical protein E2C01_001439 [Portunus trituberculatus]|uniref:Fork-head domain-containing protein n=1 Tax=Portunus trituberculatus TaxID=210409 RepID=A0A5B7CHU6_PORTR|nr:hypothetical protein [Portunus trituberculatus]
MWRCWCGLTSRVQLNSGPSYPTAARHCFTSPLRASLSITRAMRDSDSGCSAGEFTFSVFVFLILSAPSSRLVPAGYGGGSLSDIKREEEVYHYPPATSHPNHHYRTEVYGKTLLMPPLQPDPQVHAAKAYDHIDSTSSTVTPFEAPKIYDNKLYDTTKAYEKMYITKEYDKMAIDHISPSVYDSHDHKPYDKLYSSKVHMEEKMEEAAYDKCCDKTYRTLETLDSTTYDRPYDASKVVEPVDSTTYEKVQPLDPVATSLPESQDKPSTTSSSGSKKEESSKENGDLDPNKKPPYSYVALITMAIKASPERRLQVFTNTEASPSASHRQAIIHLLIHDIFLVT